MPTENSVVMAMEGRVATIRLNRPEKLNAVSLQLYRQLSGSLADVGDRTDVRAVVLTGEGRAFCVGADLEAHGRNPGDRASRAAYVAAAQSVAGTIRSLRIPVVAAVNGHAIGAGLELALACDLGVVAEDAKLRFPEIGLGTFVGGGATANLVRRVGLARAKELVLLCPMFSGAEAVEMGLLNRATPAADVFPTALELAAELAGRAPLPMALAKDLLGRAGGLDPDAVLDLEAEALLLCMETADWREGIEAFRDKRDPRFTGE
ncbi:MAG: enoyl-CoA hydratase/isomerase family protein [Gemmatimonadota bacterium]